MSYKMVVKFLAPGAERNSSARYIDGYGTSKSGSPLAMIG